jgi:hypothetical protein
MGGALIFWMIYGFLHFFEFMVSVDFQQGQRNEGTSQGRWLFRWIF